jgi:peptidoglycan-associated lipoprotein
MKLNKWIQIILVSSCVITLAACAHKKPDQSAINAANASYSNDGAESSGLGRESGFGEQAGGQRLLSKRVYYFNYDSNVVRDEDKSAIIANANYLVAHRGAKVMLEGHTDPRGSREYNIGLGERRANAVAAIFTAKGVSPAQVRVVSYGAEKLASPGHTESDYQQDRRVVLVYLKR